MPHDIVGGHIGHNHTHGDHLHSHMPEADKADDLRVLTEQFIDGFIGAKDKMAYLRLAGVPLEIDCPGGGPGMKLVDVKLTTEIGRASCRERVWIPV